MIILIKLVIVLYLVVFIHEMGHYIVAKQMGLTVTEVRIGMIPLLVMKKNGTKFSIGLIPIAGQVLAREKVGHPLKTGGNIMFSLGGTLLGLVLGSALVISYFLTQNTFLGIPLLTTGLVSICVSLVNLVPILDSDGSMVLYLLLEERYGREAALKKMLKIENQLSVLYWPSKKDFVKLLQKFIG